MRLPVQVQCIVFRNTAKGYEFLLLKRTAARGGFWQPVTGGVEDTDADLSAACFRELEEEAGIKREDVLRVTENVHEFDFDSRNFREGAVTSLHEYVFGFEVDPAVRVTLDFNVYPEHEEFRWAWLEEALRLLKWESNREALRKLRARL